METVYCLMFPHMSIMLPMIPLYCTCLHSPGAVGAHGETQGLLGEGLNRKLGRSSAS